MPRLLASIFLVAVLAALAPPLGCGSDFGEGDRDGGGGDDDDSWIGGDDDASDDDASDDDASDDDVSDDDDASEADRLTLSLDSPTSAHTLGSWSPTVVSATVVDGSGAPVSPASVSWRSSLGGDLGLAALSGQVTLAAGEQTLTVEATYGDGSSDVDDVYVVVDAPSQFEGTWRGPLLADVETEYKGFDIDLQCTGQIQVEIGPDGHGTGTGQCEVDLVEYTVLFELDGQLAGSSFVGTISSEGPDGGVGYLDTTGIFSPAQGHGTFLYDDGTNRLDGEWTVMPI